MNKAMARATLVGVVAQIMWATLAVLTAFSGRTPPFLMVAVAFSVAFLLAVGKWTLRRENPLTYLRQPPAAWTLGVGGLFGYHVLLFLAIKSAPPVEANLVNYLWPLLIVVFSGFLPGHRLRLAHLLGALSGLIGTAVLLLGSGDGFAMRYLSGYVAALAAAVTWATYSVSNNLFKTVKTDAVGWFCACGAVLALLCHLAFEPSFRPDGAKAWGVLIALGLGPAGGAFFFWDHGTKHGDIALLGVLSYAIPFASTLLLIAFGMGEASWNVAAACVLIVGGALIAGRRSFARKPPSQKSGPDRPVDVGVPNRREGR